MAKEYTLFRYFRKLQGDFFYYYYLSNVAQNGDLMKLASSEIG